MQVGMVLRKAVVSGGLNNQMVSIVYEHRGKIKSESNDNDLSDAR